MARAESKMIMGYLPLEERHCPAFLWQAGHAAMLVRPTRSAGGIDLLTVALDVTAWTRLITGGLEQSAVRLPASAVQ